MSNLEKTTRSLASLKGSTLDILKNFCIVDYNLPKNFFDSSHPSRLAMIKIDVYNAQMRNNIKEKPAELQENLQSIQSNIEQIGTKAAQRNLVAQQALTEFTNQLAPLRERAEKYDTERSKLATEVNHFIQEQRKAFQQVVQTLNKKSDTTETKISLPKINDTQSELQKRIKHLMGQEKLLGFDLSKLQKETASRVSTLVQGTVTAEQLTQLKK